MNKNKLWLLAIISITILGCAKPQSKMPIVSSASADEETKKQQMLVLDDYLNNYKNLQKVASRIITSGSDMCGEKVSAYYGFDYWNNDSFSNTMLPPAQIKYNISQKFKILHISPESPAALSGLQPKDTLVSINNWTIPIGKGSKKLLKEKLDAVGQPYSPVQVVVLRNSIEQTIDITPVQACDFSVYLAPDDVKNAYADGKNIVIYKGMMDFFKTDEEVALVFSHELAHNSMKHIDAKKKNATLGGLLGLVLDIAAATAGVNTDGNFSRLGSGLAGNAYSVDYEQEADYVGLYFMKKANYDIDNAADFWRRMAVTNSKAITVKTSHPTTSERFVAIEATVKEIKEKIEKGEPLIPELKGS